jgi:ABC-type oligopeptide transport system substrate-binding subunit
MGLRLRKLLPLSGLIILLATLAAMVAGCAAATPSHNLPDSRQIFRTPLIATGKNDINTMDPARVAESISYVPVYLTFPGLLTLDTGGRPIPWAAAAMPTFDATANTYTFHVSSGWAEDYPDPQDWLSLQFGPNAGNNPGDVVLPQANALMTQADTDLGPDRMSLYSEAEQLLVTDVAWMPLNQGKTSYSLPTYVHNVAYSSLGLIPLSTWQTIYLTAH